MRYVKYCLHVWHSHHAMTPRCPTCETATCTMHSMCTKPASSRHAQPDWIGGGCDSQQTRPLPDAWRRFWCGARVRPTLASRNPEFVRRDPCGSHIARWPAEVGNELRNEGRSGPRLRGCLADTSGRRAPDAASSRHAPEAEVASTSLQILLDCRSQHTIGGRGCDATANPGVPDYRCIMTWPQSTLTTPARQ